MEEGQAVLQACISILLSAISDKNVVVPLYTCQISGLNDINSVGDLSIYCTAALVEEAVGGLSPIQVKEIRAKSARSHRFPFVADSGGS